MSFELQGFGLRESRYERPLDRWVCGRAGSGHPCELGPTSGGRCSLSSGEVACRPVLSPRARRARVTLAASLVTLAGLVFGFAGPWSRWLASPGPLSVYHAREARAAARGEAGCRDCHVAASGVGAFASSLAGDAHRRDESGLCLDCHALGENAFSAHSTDPSRFPNHEVDSRELVCGTCHFEHRGTGQTALTDLDDERCQACHEVRFDSLSYGHPELDGYRRGFATLRFDHRAHRSKNFNEARSSIEDRAFRCTDCHLPDRERGSMTLGSYEKTCAVCHDRQIRASSDFVLIALPGLDTATLDDADVGIGTWPSEEEPAPSKVTEMLLRGESDPGADYLETLSALDPLDLSDADDDELRDVARYAWAVKRLLLDLRESGREAVSERLEPALALAPGESELARLVAGLPTETVAAAVDAWFPGVGEEIERATNGNPAATELRYPEPVERSIEPGPGEWHRDDYEMRLLYRPSGHADPLIRAWIDLAAREESTGPLYEELTGEFAAGRCTKCHVLDPSTGPLRWSSRNDDLSEREATRFTHAPHTSLFPADAGCESCHRFPDETETELEADFAPLGKAQCAACHRPRGAPDTCLTCHNYHLGDFTADVTHQ